MRRVRILVCRGPECGDKRNSAAVYAAFAEALRAQPPAGVEVQLDWQSCFGKCQRGVNVMVREVKPGEDAFFRSFLVSSAGAAIYNRVVPAEVPRIIAEHVVGGRIVADLKNRM